MAYYVYLKKDCSNQSLENLFKVAEYFQENSNEILYNNNCLYPRLKDTSKRGNAALLELSQKMGKKYSLDSLNSFVKLTRRNEYLYHDKYLQLNKIDKINDVLPKNYEETVYVGKEPYKFELVEDRQEDNLKLIKDIIKDENYNLIQLHELIKFLLDLMLNIKNKKDEEIEQGLGFSVKTN